MLKSKYEIKYSYEELEKNIEYLEIKKIINLFIKTINESKKETMECIQDNNQIFAKNINDLKLIKTKVKKYYNYSLFYFLKEYNFIGEDNITKIKTIIKTVINEYEINYFTKK